MSPARLSFDARQADKIMKRCVSNAEKIKTWFTYICITLENKRISRWLLDDILSDEQNICLYMLGAPGRRAERAATISFFPGFSMRRIGFSSLIDMLTHQDHEGISLINPEEIVPHCDDGDVYLTPYWLIGVRYAKFPPNAVDSDDVENRYPNFESKYTGGGGVNIDQCETIIFKKQHRLLRPEEVLLILSLIPLDAFGGDSCVVLGGVRYGADKRVLTVCVDEKLGPMVCAQTEAELAGQTKYIFYCSKRVSFAKKPA